MKLTNIAALAASQLILNPPHSAIEIFDNEDKI